MSNSQHAGYLGLKSSLMRLSKTTRRLVVVGFAVVASLACVTAWLIVAQRAANLAEKWQANADLAQVLAEQTSRTLQPIDLTLRELANRLSGPTPDPTSAGAASGLASKATFDLLVERQKTLPQTDALSVIGPDGRVKNLSRGFPPVPIDASERDYFQYLKAHDDHGLSVSLPVRSYLEGRWVVLFARRINDEQGQFAGVVVALVTLSYLEDFYRAVTPHDSAVSLLRRDGTMLVHYPHDDKRIGWVLPSTSPWYQSLGDTGGSYLSPGYRSGIPRLVSVRVLRDFPLVIDVSTPETAALASWRQQTLWLLGGASFAAACVILLLRVFGVQLKRLEQSQASLAQQNALLQQTAAALRESQHQVAEKSRLLGTTLEHMDQGLMVIDGDRRVPLHNQRAIELLDLPTELMASCPTFEEVLAFQWKRDEFVGSDEEFRSFVRNAMLLNGPRIYERRRPNGRVLEVRTTVLPEGEAVRTFTDVTERHNALEMMARAKEQAEEANRAKSAFLTNMSHELRTPLNAIIGFSELIRDQISGRLDTSYISYAKEINAGGRHLLKLVNDILDLSKIEAGRYDLVEEQVNLGYLLRICQRLMTGQAQAAGVTITGDLSAADVVLRIDQRAAKQVMLSLLDNGIKFSPAGGTLTMLAEPAADGGFVVQISDNGVGIPPEAMSFLFEPFRQADTSISRKYGGTGLGLAISRRLMVLMGGTIEISSMPDAGTTVSVVFPAARVLAGEVGRGG